MIGDNDDEVITCGDECANPYHEHAATDPVGESDALGRPMSSLDDPRVHGKDA